MTPGARLAAAIEVLTDVLARKSAADRTLAHWAKSHRFAGSKDRAAIAERVYTVLRRRNECAFAMSDDGPRALVLASLAIADSVSADAIQALVTDGAHAPGALTAPERERLASPARSADPWIANNYPQWLHPELAAAFGSNLASETAALNERAPLDLRVNTFKTTRDLAIRELREAGLDPSPCRLAETGIRIAAGADAKIAKLSAYLEGRIEIQDEASQVAVAFAAPKPGDTVIDLAAGAGGKSLALAAAMQNRGRVLACDVDPARLRAMEPRLARAGASNVQVIGDPYASAVRSEARKGADLVFVDAPCSGTGTWRRNPESKWTLDRGRLETYAAAQVKLLARAAELTKPGGRIAYAVCSVLPSEGQGRIAAFTAENRNWRLQAERRLTPAGDGTDGFYTAIVTHC